MAPQKQFTDSSEAESGKLRLRYWLYFLFVSILGVYNNSVLSITVYVYFIVYNNLLLMNYYYVQLPIHLYGPGVLHPM